MRVISPRGDYGARRDAAAAVGAAIHVQYHFNSGGGNYALTEITSAADHRCRQLAKLLVADFAHLFGIKNGGVKTLSRDDRGWVCIGDELPGVIIEPFFGDVATQARIARHSQDLLAEAIAKRIEGIYRPNEIIALTLGHKYKTSNPSDRGADLAGGGNEATYMEPVLTQTIHLLGNDSLAFVRIGPYSNALLVKHVGYLETLHGTKFWTDTKKHTNKLDHTPAKGAGKGLEYAWLGHYPMDWCRQFERELQDKKARGKDVCPDGKVHILSTKTGA